MRRESHPVTLLKIRITDLKGVQEVVVHEVAQDEATIGRAPGVEVVVANRQVSARHARIFRGVVVVDLNSTNGVFVGGTRVQEATLVPEGQFMLGTDLAVEVLAEVGDVGFVDEFDFEPTLISHPDEEPHAEDLPKAPALASAEAGEDGPRGASPMPREGPGTSGEISAEILEEVERLGSENAGLRRRLATLKKDIEAREAADSSSPQARLAHDAMQSVRDQNEALQARILVLEKEKGRADVEVAKQVLENRVAELESLRADLTADAERLRTQLEAVEQEKEQAAAAPSSDIFFKLQKEIQRLKSELAVSAAPAGSDASGDADGADGGSGALFFELREENTRLRKELEAAQGPTTEPATSDSEAAVAARVSELESELHRERMSKADMLAELAAMRQTAEGALAPSTPAVRPGSSSDVMALLRRAADEDVAQLPTDMGLPTAEFLSLELFRFVRQGEKVITRLAGGFMQIYNPQTVLPDTEKTLRELTIDLVNAGDDPGLRVAYTDYLEKLKKWLAVAVQVYPRAAESYAKKLRDDLSEESLTKKDPIPRLKRISGHAEGELWARATKVLNRLSDETVQDGVERLARGYAAEVIDGLD
ncbi:MAG: hypothetical protein ACJAZN_000628 [Planctomycetota bacterium]